MSSRHIRHALRQRGANVTRDLPEDVAEFDDRVRRGLRGENSKAFGKAAARSTIVSRVRGDHRGRRDER